MSKPEEPIFPPVPEYMRSLAEKLMGVPATYGVDQGDVDHLTAVIEQFEAMREALEGVKKMALYTFVGGCYTLPKEPFKEVVRVLAGPCPECGGFNFSRSHHEADASAPECHYWECECGHQWGHE